MCQMGDHSRVTMMSQLTVSLRRMTIPHENVTNEERQVVQDISESVVTKDISRTWCGVSYVYTIWTGRRHPYIESLPTL